MTDYNLEFQKIYWELRKELQAQNKAVEPWYSHLTGNLNFPEIAKNPDIRIQKLMSKISDLNKRYIAENEQSAQSNRKLIEEKVPHEIEKASRKKAETIIKPEIWKYIDEPQKPDWISEIEDTSGLHTMNIAKPIVIMPAEKRPSYVSIGEKEGKPVNVAGKLEEEALEELRAVAKKYLSSTFQASPEMQRVAKEFISMVEKKSKGVEFYASSSSWQSSEGKLIGSIGFLDTYNKNLWKIDSSELPSILKQLNEGCPFRVEHSDNIRDWVGDVSSASLINGEIIVQVERIDDPDILRILKKHPKGLGLSIRMNADAYCGSCGEKIVFNKSCMQCGSNLKIAKNCITKEVSLCSSPAWHHARVLKFEESD